MNASGPAARLVARTCAEQGLPEAVSDLAVLRQLAGLLRRRNGEGALSGPDATIATTAAAAKQGGRRGRG